MKTFISAILLVIGSLGAQAGGYHYYHHHDWGHGPSISFYWGSPYYPGYSYGAYPSYWSYPAYGPYPAYSYDYTYTRPNYAVSGTLLGALTGGLIGNSIHHQGWEGAGIGAAAGLLLGSVAEQNARTYERSCYAAPRVSYAQPNYIANAPVVNDPPTVPAAPQVQDSPKTTYTSYRSTGTMGSANSLFGR